jgi:hypothetical protein
MSLRMSSPVITECTPGRCAALRTSIARIRPCAMVLRTTLPCSIPGTRRLWTYSARPVTLSRASSRGMDWPTCGMDQCSHAAVVIPDARVARDPESTAPRSELVALDSGLARFAGAPE